VTGQAFIVQGDALHLPLPAGSVDLIVTSPPFYALRAYGAGPGEIGSEPSPQAYLEALWAATAEMMRVLKPTGSAFVDLGDKYNSAASNQNMDDPERVARIPSTRWGRSGGTTYNSRTVPTAKRGVVFGGMPQKSLLLLPERYRIGCVDRLGLIARAVIIWNKPNPLPGSQKDRVNLTHEDWVHLVKQPRYYSATDEIREPQQRSSGVAPPGRKRTTLDRPAPGVRMNFGQDEADYNPLGKLPGSVWTISSEPLTLPGYFVMADGQLRQWLNTDRGSRRPRPNGHHPGLFDPDPYVDLIAGGDGPAWRWLRATGITSSPWPQTDEGDQLRVAAAHYAAFPSRWPEQLIKGFSPPGICVECGQGRVPVVERERRPGPHNPNGQALGATHDPRRITGAPTSRSTLQQEITATILGYACSCTPFTDHPGSGEPRDIGDEVKWSPNGQNPRQRQVGGHLANAPRVGPWREYHLSGWRPPPTRPAVVLDVFSGTGTTPMVARALGRIGIGVDLSHDYCRAARWRVRHDGAKAISRTNLERQGILL
jgi:DNA modification methylase